MKKNARKTLVVTCIALLASAGCKSGSISGGRGADGRGPVSSGLEALGEGAAGDAQGAGLEALAGEVVDVTQAPKPDLASLGALAQSQADALAQVGARGAARVVSGNDLPASAADLRRSSENQGATADLQRAKSLQAQQAAAGALAAETGAGLQDGWGVAGAGLSSLDGQSSLVGSGLPTLTAANAKDGQAIAEHKQGAGQGGAGDSKVKSGEASGVRTVTGKSKSPPSRSAMTGESGEASDEELVELARRMARLLREPALRDRPRMPDAAALAPLEALRAGALRDLEDLRSVLGSGLSSADRKTLIDARERLAGEPGLAAQDMNKAVAGLSPQRTLSISKSALCTKVMGFGKYTAYEDIAFPAGQPVRAIVYIELDHFQSRPARETDPGVSAGGGDQQSVELSQALSLYNHSDDLLVWRRAPQTIIEAGHRARRDFYLIQQIELPKTLSVGKYHLKVSITDKVSNAQTEAVLPLNIVAK